MTDYFALLGQPRRPWLDPAELDRQFHQLSKRFHPDKVGSDSGGQADRHFAELNAAYQCLRTPKNRLQHLVQLESAHSESARRAEATGSHEVPAEIAEFFMTINRELREADAFISKWSAAGALLKAGMFAAAQEMIEGLRLSQTEIQRRTAELDAALVALNDRWQDGAAHDLAELQRLHRLYGFYGKWLEQLGARVTRLMV